MDRRIAQRFPTSPATITRRALAPKAFATPKTKNVNLSQPAINSRNRKTTVEFGTNSLCIALRAIHLDQFSTTLQQSILGNAHGVRHELLTHCPTSNAPYAIHASHISNNAKSLPDSIQNRAKSSHLCSKSTWHRNC